MKLSLKTSLSPEQRSPFRNVARRVSGGMVALALALLPGIAAAATAAPADVQFMRDIAPLLVQRCTSCHGAIKDEGGVRFHTYERLLDSAVIVAGQPEKSELFTRLVADDPDDRMPREDTALTAAQIDLFRRWIKAGAKFDGADPKVALKTLFGPREHPAAPATYPTAVPVLALALAPGGKEVAVGGYHEVTIWDAATGKLVRRLGHLPEKIQTLAYNHEGTQLLVGGGTPGDYGELALVDANSGARLRVFDTFTDVVLSACFRDDGQRVAASSADQSVRVYDTADGHRMWNMKLHADWVTGVAFSSDRRYVASSSKDKTVKVYDAETGALYTTYTGHNRMIGKYAGQNPVYALKFVPGSQVALSAGGGAWIQLWEPEKAYAENGTAADMEDRFKMAGHTRYIAHGATQEVFALAVDQGQVFAASADGLVKQFNLETLTEVRSYLGHQDWVYALDFNAAVNRLATGDYSGEVRIWDTTTGTCVIAFKSMPGGRGAAAGTVAAAGR
jgi:outer membrane protein assembly factor BamB